MKHLNKLDVYKCIYRMYRRLYRTLFIFATFLFCAILLRAQPQFTDGTWSGNLILQDDSSSLNLRITLSGNHLVQIDDETKTDKWFKKARLVQQRDNGSLIFWWTHECQFGVQSKVYKLTAVSSDSATVTWWQHNLIYGEKIRDDEGWQIAGTGLLVRQISTGDIVRKN